MINKSKETKMNHLQIKISCQILKINIIYQMKLHLF